jgi:hypothetical protein
MAVDLENPRKYQFPGVFAFTKVDFKIDTRRQNKPKGDANVSVNVSVRFQMFQLGDFRQG